MAVISRNNSNGDDPLLPWLCSIEKALRDLNSPNNNGPDIGELAYCCIQIFKTNIRYRDDVRFLKIWFLYMDGSPDSESVFGEMELNKICLYNSLLYEWYALFLEAKGKLSDALQVYDLGISSAEFGARNAEPEGRLRKAQSLFLERMSEVVHACSLQKVDANVHVDNEGNYINPWSISTVEGLLQKMNAEILKYKGYYRSTERYSGKVSLSSLKKSIKNKVFIKIGAKKYQIIGCAGQGGFAQVFKAYVNGDQDDVVALKIQTPAFPWEFYIYRQLDKRIPDKERKSFGFAHRLHLYSDYSILVSDYLSHGTLQDAIASNWIMNVSMDEVLCIYYTVEMLSMLEALHGARIIHGDFKPNNLLIRYARDDLTEDGLRGRTGPWNDQGLCLIDWGRGIDVSLFPSKIEFKGDCRTSGFRCIEMQENKPWTFQVDLYGLCVIVHMMLYNSYMEIEKKASSDGGYIYQPKSALKRYWRVELWQNLFRKLLNPNPREDHVKLLQNLKESFQDYLCSDSKLIKKLNELLVKQRGYGCSA